MLRVFSCCPTCRTTSALSFTPPASYALTPLYLNSHFLRPQHVKEVEPGVCELVFLMQPDPRGKIPTWTVSKAIGGSIADQFNHWSTYQMPKSEAA